MRNHVQGAYLFKPGIWQEPYHVQGAYSFKTGVWQERNHVQKAYSFKTGVWQECNPVHLVFGKSMYIWCLAKAYSCIFRVWEKRNHRIMPLEGVIMYT